MLIGVIYDHGYIAHLDKNKVTIVCNGAIILHGHRQHDNSLWIVYSTGTIPHKISTYNTPVNIPFIFTPYPYYFTTTQRICFIYDILGFPSISTLCDVLDMGSLTSLKYISAKLWRKHHRHLQQQCRGF